MSGPPFGPGSPAAAAIPDETPEAWRDGVRDGLPSLLGIGAWGIVVGVAMVKSGLTVAQALGMTFLVFAGSAQLAALPLIAAGAPVWVVFATALIINLRFVIFSALLAPHFAHLTLRQRLALGYTVGDLTAALYFQRYPSEERAPGKLSYLKGLIIPNWIAWQVGSVAGILAGAAVPAEWGLAFAGSLAILCILVPLVASLPAVCGVLVAAVTAIACHRLPFKLGLLAAVVAGMACAILAEEWREKRAWRRRPGRDVE
jgi:predicted branched-subunit amino acid permease